MAQRDVLVNGVQVPMFTAEKGERTRPMRATLRWLAMDPEASFGGAPREDALAAIEALREAGVKSIPLYEDEAREAGIEWTEFYWEWRPSKSAYRRRTL